LKKEPIEKPWSLWTCG